MNKLIEYFIKQSTFVNLLTIFVFVLGTFSFVNIKREVFPNINFDTIVVQTSYPGGSTESTELLITSPLEQDLKEVDGIKKITSMTVEGQSVIMLQLDPNQVEAEDAKTEIQDVVDGFTSLPEDALDPKVSLIESKNQPIIQVAVSGEVTEIELREAAKKIKNYIEKSKGVAKVEYNGFRDYEIKVNVDPKKMKKYQLSLLDVNTTIKNANKNIPGGIIEASPQRPYEMIISTAKEYKNIEDVKNTILRANVFGENIRVRDIANVVLELKKEDILLRTNGKRSINLTILKKANADAINVVDSVKEASSKIKEQIGKKIEISFIDDYSFLVRRRIKVLTSNLLVGLILVLIILSILLPFRIALVTSFGIPFSFLGALMIFHWGEISLNMISLMGLIIVIGMLVDDAVVVTENAQQKIDEGLPPEQGAIKGAQEIWPPVFASVLTTIIAFAPLMFMSGIFGKFVKNIPVGVILSLVVSLIECFFILPHHIASWVKVSKDKKPSLGKKIWEQYILAGYLKLLDFILKFRYLFIVSFVGLLVFSFKFAKNNVPFVLFPPGDIDVFTINIETKSGTELAETTSVVSTIEKQIMKLEKNELQDFSSKVGIQKNDATFSSKRGGQYAQIIVYLTPEIERKRKAIEIIDNIRDNVPKIPSLKEIKFERRRAGPPVGKAISVGVRGSNFDEIKSSVKQLKSYLADVEGVSDLSDSFIEGKKEIQLEIKDKERVISGLSLHAIGTTIRAAYEGLIANSIRKVDEDIDIRISLENKFKNSLKTISDLEVTNSRGQLIPLLRVTEVAERSSIASIEHEDNQRQITITGEIDTKLNNASNVAKILKNKIKKNEHDFSHVTVHFGGENEDTQESFQSLGQAFAFAFFGILLLLILLFKNVYQPLIVASTIPIGVVGVIWTFYFHNKPLSFLAAVGIIALSGVVVNNAIVFVDFFNRAKSQYKDKKQAILDAAKRRIRAIFLTTFTTVAGILPTAYGIGGMDPFVVPIALSLGWGILISAFLSSLLLPPILLISHDCSLILDTSKNFIKKIKDKI